MEFSKVANSADFRKYVLSQFLTIENVNLSDAKVPELPQLKAPIIEGGKAEFIELAKKAYEHYMDLYT